MKTTRSASRLFSEVCICLFAFLLLWAGPVLATDNYAYRADEYAVISGGKSPDGRWSIAAHGDGSTGDDGFQLYLMGEPEHKQAASLPTDEHLDTAPLSNVALWAPDSRHAAILYRTDRHILDVRLFGVAAGRVQSIKVPSLVSTASHGRLKPDGPYELFGCYYQFKWQDPKQFILEEFDGFRAARPISRVWLKAYLKADGGEESNLTFFSAGAVCRLTTEGEISLFKLRPLPDQNRTIIYSPHLRVDPERGLYDTETSTSSLEAQKSKK